MLFPAWNGPAYLFACEFSHPLYQFSCLLQAKVFSDSISPPHRATHLFFMFPWHTTLTSITVFSILNCCLSTFLFLFKLWIPWNQALCLVHRCLLLHCYLWYTCYVSDALYCCQYWWARIQEKDFSWRSKLEHNSSKITAEILSHLRETESSTFITVYCAVIERKKFLMCGHKLPKKSQALGQMLAE